MKQTYAILRKAHPAEFPIMVGTALSQRVRRGENPVVVKSIPWDMIDADPCREWAKINHGGQDLVELANRQGLSACEAICVISCMNYQAIGENEGDAHRILYAMRALFSRGKLLGSPADVGTGSRT
jgi:hypothetical protein